MDPQDELLRWHYYLGHLPFDRIKQLANKGQLPKRLLNCHTPFCAACQYGKMTKSPWRVKGDDKATAKKATYPGQVVLVDQMEKAQGNPHSTKVQVRHHIRRSIFQIHFRILAKMGDQPRNRHGQACVRAICRATRDNNQALPHRQRACRGQCVHTGLPSKQAKPLVLRREHSLSERHSRAPYKGPTGTNKNLHAIRHEQVAENGHH